MGGNCFHHDALEQDIIHHLLLKSPFLTDVGLRSGKMGVALMFFLYAQKKKCPVYTDVASDILEDVWNAMESVEEVNCQTLCGIGWCIEFLIQHCIVEGDADDVCIDIDRKVQPLLNKTLTVPVDEKFSEVWDYIGARQQGAFLRNCPMPFHGMLDEMHGSPISKIRSYFPLGNKVNLTRVKKCLRFSPINEANFLQVPLGLDGLAGWILNRMEYD